MSEWEMLEVSQMMWGNALTVVGLLITLISGYLIAAYMAGSGMSRSQVIIINTLYVGFATFLLLSMLAFVDSATEVDVIALEISAQRSEPVKTHLAYSIAIFVIFCVLASLKFMWDVRHPKAK